MSCSIRRDPVHPALELSPAITGLVVDWVLAISADLDTAQALGPAIPPLIAAQVTGAR
jgi:hypothetical protein